MASEKLSSISEYGKGSTRTSLTGLSMFSGYSQSPSSGSLSTLASASTRSYKPNGLPGERKNTSGENANHIMAQRIRGTKGPKHNYEFCKKVRVSMALIGILFLVAAIFMLSFYLPKQYQNPKDVVVIIEEKEPWSHMIKFHPDLHLSFSTNTTETLENPSKIALEAYLGVLLTDSAKKTKTVKEENETIVMYFKDVESTLVTLNITKNSSNPQCFEITWLARYDHKLEDCFDTMYSHWYGLGEVLKQKWPLDKSSFKMSPFLTTDYIDQYATSTLGGVLEPFAVNSKGAGIYIDEKVALHISMNDGGKKRMCIRADPTTTYNEMYRKTIHKNATNILKYTICIEENIKKVHELMFNRFIERPKTVPDLMMMKKPIWSTWVRYKRNINETIIRVMVDEITKYKFEYSHLQIEGKYSTEYGDLNFDRSRFDEVTTMLDVLKSLGFRVTVWASPFANLESQMFRKGLVALDDHESVWIKVGRKDIPGITKWWEGVAGILDTTNPNARKWFVNKLKEFQKLKINGFKFDAGETTFLPVNYKFSENVPNPNYYTKYYVEMASQFDLSEVRVGYKSQKYPVFVRMLDRISYWKTENGLPSVLTAALTFSILGYPYLIPDMVGGNAYVRTPKKELYVRWAQLSAFLPCIQFSITPWDYDSEVVEIVRKALSIRKNLTHIIVGAAQNYSATGVPIIRPLWWYWPEDHETFVVDSEFMLGEDYLIAPVLHLNIVSHAVYLPAGIWEEQWGKRETLNMTVGALLHYNVTLHDICYFRLVSMID